MGCCNSKPKEKKPVEKKPEEKKPEAPQAPPPQRPPTPPTPKQEEEDVAREVEPEEPAQAPPDPRAERLAAIVEMRQHRFRFNCCTVEGGDVHALFEEGLVYRIVKDGVWYIYNDTLDYEAHVDYRFGPGSQIVPGERTSLQTGPDGWITAHAVVYPLETVQYISGTYRGFKSAVTARAVSPEYLSEMARSAKATAQDELDAVQRLAGSETNEEVILARCVSRNVPYVDVNFPPTGQMLCRHGVDAREIQETGMQRPTQYLSDDKKNDSNAIVGPVVPHSIDPGYLGDCWVTCAAAILAEDEETVANAFISTKPDERGVGAYRVALSKHGWWRSVIVDSYLPTVNNMPLFARIADDPRELWVSLLEKAYAKVHGSYSVITGGDALQVLQDVTGAPTYRFDKEWEGATMNSDKVRGFTQKLIGYSEAGYGIVLSTPAHTSASYLGCKRDKDPEAFKQRYTRIGLRCGYTYAIGKIVSVDGVVLFKVHNPWNSTATWTGAWAKGSEEWDDHPKAYSVCDPDNTSVPGSFWISWNDAINYFDGGGVVYCTPDAVDYRVKGTFQDVVPSVVLQIEAKEAVTVTLVLSQQDKRGGCENAAGLRFAPCMLSVAKHNGHRYVVEANSSWDPAAPSSEYNFMVARDMALTYTFEPSETPYLVVPRIHRKGVSANYDRPYTLGVIGHHELDGKLNIRCTHIEGESRVFKNIITFSVDDFPSVVAEHQTYKAGEMPQVASGEMVLGTAPVKTVAPAAASASASEEALTEEEDNNQNDARAADVTEEQEVTITDNVGTPINVQAPDEQTEAINFETVDEQTHTEAINFETVDENTHGGEGTSPATPVNDEEEPPAQTGSNGAAKNSDADSQDEL